jgi:hypothetical protein
MGSAWDAEFRSGFNNAHGLIVTKWEGRTRRFHQTIPLAEPDFVEVNRVWKAAANQPATISDSRIADGTSWRVEYQADGEMASVSDHHTASAEQNVSVRDLLKKINSMLPEARRVF